MGTDYGTDVSAEPDLDPMFPEQTGRALLIEALARRFETPRGSLFYDPDYGFDLRALIGEGLADGDLFALQAAIAAECRKDERVVAARAVVALDRATSTMTVTIAAADGAGPFRLVLDVSTVSVALLGVDAP
jgi:hypothetical protein